jgi:hypothetical protein
MLLKNIFLLYLESKIFYVDISLFIAPKNLQREIFTQHTVKKGGEIVI